MFLEQNVLSIHLSFVPMSIPRFEASGFQIERDESGAMSQKRMLYRYEQQVAIILTKDAVSVQTPASHYIDSVGDRRIVRGRH